jgi:hypothetical protein
MLETKETDIHQQRMKNTLHLHFYMYTLLQGHFCIWQLLVATSCWLVYCINPYSHRPIRVTGSEEQYVSNKVRTLYYALKVMNNLNNCYDHQSL